MEGTFEISGKNRYMLLERHENTVPGVSLRLKLRFKFKQKSSHNVLIFVKIYHFSGVGLHYHPLKCVNLLSRYLIFIFYQPSSGFDTHVISFYRTNYCNICIIIMVIFLVIFKLHIIISIVYTVIAFQIIFFVYSHFVIV